MVKLIPFEAKIHSALLFNWRNQSEIAQFMYSQEPISKEQHTSWVKGLNKNTSQIHWVVEYRSVPVGAASLSNIDHENARAVYGMYIADTGAKLMGVGAAAEFLALEYAFNKLRLHKLSSEVFSANEAPIRMHLRMGYVEEGILRDHARFKKNWVDVHLLSILNHEWQGQRKPLKKLLSKLLVSQ